MLYRIRAHHGMCFFFFSGKGYSPAFTEHMRQMKRKLAQNPEVLLLAETDDVCARCPHNCAGVCASAEKVEHYDRQVLALCKLECETRIRWEDFEALVEERILAAGRREEICGDCQWSSLCADRF